MNKKSVLVLGDVNVDLVIPLRSFDEDKPLPRTETPRLHGGGTGGNTAAALARLGVPVSFIGTVGDDGYGRWSAEDLQDEGVDIRYLHIVDQAFTPIVMAVIRPDGERELFVWPDRGGAHTRLSAGLIKPEIFRSAAWLHTTGLCLREEPVRTAQLQAMQMAREEGVGVSLDMNLRLETWGLEESLREVFDQAIAYSDVIFGSGNDEIIPYTGLDSVQAGSEKLSGGRRTVIARLGSKGALAVAPADQFSVPAFEVEVVDTLGAGDAFNGGFICAQLEGLGLKESVRWGNAAAGLKIGQSGARGLPTRNELIVFLNSV
jgi:sugar/nucleoside kinase (ribokinase family)